MRKLVSGMASVLPRTAKAAVGSLRMPASIRRGPVFWLILSGALLIAAIVIGTALMAAQFRERALRSSERELENTVQLLARHFDQQFEDCGIITNDLISKMRISEGASPDGFRRGMSTFEAHQTLKSKVSGLPGVGDVNVYDADGILINSTGPWPVPAISIAERPYFQSFKSGSQPASARIEAVVSSFTDQWATVIAHRLSGPDGALLGVIVRRIDPAYFEKFFASLSLGEGAAISMFHHDGTMLVRYPHADTMIGQKFNKAPLLAKLLAEGGQQTLRVRSPVDNQDRLGSGAELSGFPIMVVATTTVSSALADWREQIRFLVVAAIVSALAIALILFLIVRQLARQEPEIANAAGIGKAPARHRAQQHDAGAGAVRRFRPQSSSATSATSICTDCRRKW